MPMNPRLLRPLARGRYNALRVGLVAYWPLNETAASGDVTADDWTGRGNNLTSNNSVLSTTGKIGNARDFVSANSEYLSRASNTDLQFGDGNWSIAAWVYVRETGTATQTFISKEISGAREIQLSVQTNTSTTANRFTGFIFHTDQTAFGINSPLTANADFINKWYHVVVTHASGLVTMYVNGSSAATANRAAGKALAATNTQFDIGRSSFVGFPQYFNGIIDEPAKWNRALSATEVAALHNNGTGIDLRQ